MATEKCYRCGSTRLEAGFADTGLNRNLLFTPNDLTFWTLTRGVALDASLCMDCGAVEFFCNPKDAEGLLAKTDKNSE
jgi:hypothetical protein